MSELLVVKFHEDAKAPVRATEYSAGYDIFAIADGEVEPWKHALIRTGIAIRLPDTSDGSLHYAKLKSRSSLSVKYGIEVGAGTIDLDFTKEMHVVLRNFSDVVFTYKKHDRIAQMIIEKCSTPSVRVVTEFPELKSDRVGGFGSTGV